MNNRKQQYIIGACFDMNQFVIREWGAISDKL